MGKFVKKANALHKKVIGMGGPSPSRYAMKAVVGEDVMKKIHPDTLVTDKVSDVYNENFDDIHPLGTQVEQAYDATKAAEAAAATEETKKPQEMPDNERLARLRRKSQMRRRNQGRASTILGNDAETLG